jgi:hypothetical protein
MIETIGSISASEKDDELLRVFLGTVNTPCAKSVKA